MYDFTDYTLRDLFKIRDCLDTLNEYGLADEDEMYEVSQEIERRADESHKTKGK